MNFRVGIRPFLLAAIFAGISANAPAQSLIKLDNDGCGEGLKELAAIAGAELAQNASPRKIAGSCEVKALTIRAEGVEISVDSIKWNRAGLLPLTKGQMPENLRLQLQGVRVINAPQDQPGWQFLASEARLGRKFDAGAELVFSADTGVLEIARAGLDFGNGNTAGIHARLHGVSASLPKSPAVAGLAAFVDEAGFSLSQGNARSNTALALAMSALQGSPAGKDIEGLRATALTMIKDGMGAEIDSASRKALERLIGDLPEPTGGLRLMVQAPDGFALLRLAILSRGGTPEMPLSGTVLDFVYGPDVTGEAE